MNRNYKIIAVDFDGTLVVDKFPEIGEKAVSLFNELKTLRKLGMVKLILWTCRTDQYLENAIKFCSDNGLEFDAINANLPEIKEYWGGDPQKVFADIYVDDKAMLPHKFDFNEI